MEELGGCPLLVNFRTVTIGKACGNAYEGNSLQLSYQRGKTISDVSFARYGNPKGNCESFEKGNCDSPNTLSIIKKVSMKCNSFKIFILIVLSRPYPKFSS